MQPTRGFSKSQTILLIAKVIRFKILKIHLFTLITLCARMLSAISRKCQNSKSNSSYNFEVKVHNFVANLLKVCCITCIACEIHNAQLMVI